MTLAHEALEAAKTTLESGHLHSAVNRIYYSCFYSVSALLVTEGHSSSKHSGVRSLFNQHWIKTGRLPVEMSAIYQDCFVNRQQGDYDDFVTFVPEDVCAWQEQAVAFVERISQELDKLLSAQ
jgi:uncharacterized protein (UPF0332 family)